MPKNGGLEINCRNQDKWFAKVLLWIVGTRSHLIAFTYLTLFEPVDYLRIVDLGVPSFACTPDLFSDWMAAAINGRAIRHWATAHDIMALIFSADCPVSGDHLVVEGLLTSLSHSVDLYLLIGDNKR